MKKMFLHRKKDLTFVQFEENIYRNHLMTLLPGSNNTYFAAIRNVGLFRSTDEGKSWIELVNGLHSKYVVSLYQDINNNLWVASGSGLYFSSDYGDSWERRVNGIKNMGAIVQCDNKGNVYVGTYGSGIWRSTDLEQNWYYLGVPVMGNCNIAFNIKGHIIYGNGQGYISEDDGKTWRSMMVPRGPISIAVSKDDKIFCGGDYDIFWSDDNGYTWNKVGRDPNGDYFTQVSALAFNSEGHLFAGTETGIWKSEDDGQSWKSVVSMQIDRTPPVFSIIFDNKQGKGFATINAVGNSRFWETTDNGITWIVNAGNCFGNLALDSAGNLYAGIGSEMQMSIDGGKT